MDILMITLLLFGPILILASYFFRTRAVLIGMNFAGILITGILLVLASSFIHKQPRADFRLPYTSDGGLYEIDLQKGYYLIYFHRSIEDQREPFPVYGALSLSAVRASSEIPIFHSDDVASDGRILLQDVSSPTFFFEHPGGKLRIESRLETEDGRRIEFITLRSRK